MKISEVKFARKFNTGNYESEEYGVTAIVEDDETACDVFKQLKSEVQAAYSGEQTEGEQNESVESDSSRGPGKKSGKNIERDSDADAKENEDDEIEGEDEAEGEEGKEEDVKGNADSEAEDGDESEDSQDEEAGDAGPTKSKSKSAKQKPKTSSETGTPGKGKKSFKKKAQVYQRSNETHKEIFSGLLKTVAPNWKADEKSKTRAKDASVKLEGEDFLDESGDVVDTFIQSVKKHMSGKKK